MINEIEKWRACSKTYSIEQHKVYNLMLKNLDLKLIVSTMSREMMNSIVVHHNMLPNINQVTHAWSSEICMISWTTKMHISFSGVRDRVHAIGNVVNYHKTKAFKCMNVIPCTTSCCTFPNIQRNKRQIPWYTIVATCLYKQRAIRRGKSLTWCQKKL